VAAALKKTIGPPANKSKQSGFWSSHPHKSNWGPSRWQILQLWKTKEEAGTGKQQQQEQMINFRKIINTTCVKFNKMCQPYPRMKTGSETKTSHRDLDKSRVNNSG